MPRKIFLDGNANGDRPSPIFALLLCLIPIATFMYMKHRQGQRLGQTPDLGQVGVTEQPLFGPARPQNTEDRSLGSAELLRLEKERKQDKEALEKAKKEWEEKIESEKKKVEVEKKKRDKAESSLKATSRELREEKQKMLAARMDHDREMHPDDPALNGQTPEEAYDKINPINKRPLDPSKRAMRPARDGKSVEGYVQKPKDLKWIDDEGDRKHPVERLATYLPDRKKLGEVGRGGFVEHDNPENRWVPADQRKSWNQKLADKAKAGQSLRDRSSDMAIGLNISLLQQKTEQLKKSSGDHSGITEVFQTASRNVAAKPGSPEYEQAMKDTWHDDFGMFPGFALPAIEKISSLLDDDDAKKVLQGMANMWKVVERHAPSGHPNGKDPNGFIKRHCMEANPKKDQFVNAWYMDSFRLVPTRVRMNVIRGAPENMEKTLGVKYLLLEWLEIFGTLCARQRLLSQKGFDFPGQCMRLHCLRRNTRDVSWKLNITVFLPGGPEKIGKDGKPLETWAKRFEQATFAWNDIWTQLINETAAYGTMNEGYQAFADRELTFCPGYTFEGLRQANGLPQAESTPRGPDAAQPTRYTPILNAFTPPKFPSPGLGFFLQKVAQPFGYLRATKIIFLRRRQHSWCTASMTEKSHDFAQGMIALCLEVMKRVPNEVQHVVDGDEHGIRASPDYDRVEVINFGSTIPMTIMTRGDKEICRFPDLAGFPNLNRISMAYVPVPRGANGQPTASSSMPATAVLVLSPELGLKALLKAKETDPVEDRRLRLHVDIKRDHIQQLADELYEQLVGLAKLAHGSQWQPLGKNIDSDAREDKAILRQVYCESSEGAVAITDKIPKITWT